MRYQAYNRKTGRMVQVVTEAEKLAFQSTPSTDVFRYVPIYTPPAPKPEGIKPAPAQIEEKAKPSARPRKKRSSKPGKDDTNNR